MIDTIVDKKITYLNGARFKRAFIAGAKKVISRHDYLNKINVFPVSDSDTGTNISITLSAGLKAVALEQHDTLPNVLASFADGTLEYARGNSGTIFAQWFQGFSEANGEHEQMDTPQFIKIFQSAAEHAYQAVAEPVEGTILTVLMDTANYLTGLANPSADFADLFTDLVKKANQSLSETPEKLKVLKKFGVVDAGAQALVDFFEGISSFIHQGDIKDLAAEIAEIAESHIDEESLHTHGSEIEDYNYRFCTECVIIGDSIDQSKLKQMVAGLGDSLVLAGSKRKAKIHMHVNEPAELFRICRQFGKLLNEKAEDMFHQIKDAHVKHSEIAIVTDSSLDLPQDILDSLNIHVIPIRIHVGDDAYIDRVTISSKEFYDIVEKQGVLPKTAHPTYSDFKAKYQFLNSHYKSIISIHIAKSMSNTAGMAELVQRDLENTKLAVIDSKMVSGALGLIVQYAAELANAGYSYEDILQRIDDIIPKTYIYTCVGNLDYAVKGGRVPKFVKSVADFLRIKPILEVRFNHKPKITGVIRNQRDFVAKMATKIAKKLDPHKRYRIGVMHCEVPEQGQQLLDLLLKHAHNIESSFMVDCGVTIGSHTGPGTLGVAVQEYQPI
jgi:DegV family protein with EDD domain